MSQSVDSMIDDIIRREGGFVDHPADRGGPTCYGITQRTLARYLGREVTRDDVRGLSRELAAEIYRRAYYLEPRIDALPPGIRAFLFDSAVNHGPRRAIKFLQQVLNAAGFGPLGVDGLSGPQTRRDARSAADVMGPWLLAALAEERRMFYRLIVARDPAQRVFLNGWMKRVAEFDQRSEGVVA
ncbi:MAG: glycoside hydrolase family 108 protein [Rhizobiales bacterium]|nr:glycoside hydrolase family 108 protein [Hyphomicrobiales bacterium]